jgi:hypothetical protein
VTSRLVAGHRVVASLLSADHAGRLAAELRALAEGDPRVDRAGQVVGSAELYGHPTFDDLLVASVDLVAAAAGVALVPTYSFARLYERGQVLEPHRDRPACELSASVHLGASSTGQAWPLHLRARGGSTTSVELGPGDALVYEGIDVLHWRDACPVDWYAQVFLHYVDPDGPHATHHLDGRPAIGSHQASRP